MITFLLSLLGLYGVGMASGGSSAKSPTVESKNDVLNHDEPAVVGGVAADEPMHEHDDAADDTPDEPAHEHDDAVDDTPDEPAHEHDDAVDDTPDEPMHEHGDAADDDADEPMHEHGDAADDDADEPMHEHGDAAITPPGKEASVAEINTYLSALSASDELHIHEHESPLASEHSAAMDLVPRGAATNVAIDSGDWFDPAIWSTGEVPGSVSKVLIPEGITVTYGEVSDVEILTVRVDGALEFATDSDSQMIFDTMVISPTGHLEIGTVDNPVNANVNVDLIVANNGPIDVEWDPMLLSRGVIGHGSTSIHGSVKDSHEKVVEDPMAGDTSVTFDGLPEGWQVGDKIVIAATNYDGYKWDNAVHGIRFHGNEDEVRIVSSIEGDTVHFEDALEFDHGAPREDLKTSVANYTRNVSIESEDPENADVSERGHVMFMHSDDVDVRYAEFLELGRTDKSEDSFSIDDIDTVAADSNVQGRYSLHIHRTGVDDIDDPAILEGNAVFGSPGWGIVHHDSNALIENNATYDTFGAGYVAETGNETGAWNDNIAIFAQGTQWNLPKNTNEYTDNFDTARGGEGFHFQGRLVESTDNIAVSTGVGYSYFHRDFTDTMINSQSEHFEFPDAFIIDEGASDLYAIRVFEGNETFASYEGLHVTKANPNQGHDIWSHMKDFTAWDVISGVTLDYTAHYILEDFDLVGKGTEDDFSLSKTGITADNNVSELVIKDTTVDGFRDGLNLQKILKSFDHVTTDDFQHILVDVEIMNSRADDLLNFIPGQDRMITDFDPGEYDVDLELDAPLVYSQTPIFFAGYNSLRTIIDGTKTDGLGETEFPGGTEQFSLRDTHIIKMLEEDGYWTTSDGDSYGLIDLYLTDRATGDVYYETHAISFDDNVPLGDPVAAAGAYADAKFNGIQDFVEVEGQIYAGEALLDTAILAKSASGDDTAFNEMIDDIHGANHQMTTHQAPSSSDSAEDIWTVLTEGHGTFDESLPSEQDDESLDDMGEM